LIPIEQVKRVVVAAAAAETGSAWTRRSTTGVLGGRGGDSQLVQRAGRRCTNPDRAATPSENGHSTRDAHRAITKRRSRRKQRKLIDGYRTRRGTSTVQEQRDASGVGDHFDDLHRSATRAADRDVDREHPRQQARPRKWRAPAAGLRRVAGAHRPREHRVEQRKLPRSYIVMTIASGHHQAPEAMAIAEEHPRRGRHLDGVGGVLQIGRVDTPAACSAARRSPRADECPNWMLIAPSAAACIFAHVCGHITMLVGAAGSS
jgi:hypothetical protein